MLTSWVSWRGGLFINVPLGVALIWLAPRYLPETERRRGHFDLPGALTSTLGMTALVYGLVRAAETGWGDAWTLASFVAGAVLLAFFVANERTRRAADHAAAPVLEPRAGRRLRRPGDGRRGDVLDLLLPHPVPAGRAGLRPAARPAAPSCR